MIIIKYVDESEVQSIIDEQTANGLNLVAVSNVTAGNFLGFSVTQEEPPSPTSIEQQIVELKNDNLILMDVLATMYEDMLAKGTV